MKLNGGFQKSVQSPMTERKSVRNVTINNFLMENRKEID